MTNTAPHIAVVDEHPQIRELRLGTHGFWVSEAASAATFRKLMERSALDLVVLDVVMPGKARVIWKTLPAR